MDPLTAGALISGGSQLIGGIIGNNSAAAAARENRAWQERMSNTSYQRGVKDLRKAGLNPALAYGQGGASTPSGGIADVPNANLGDSASSAVMQRAQLRLIRGQAMKQEQDAAYTFGENANLENYQKAMLDNIRSNTARSLQETRNAALTGAGLEFGLPGLRRQGEFEGGNFRNVMRYVESGMKGVGPLIGGAAGGLLGSASARGVQAIIKRVGPGAVRMVPGLIP